MVAFFEGPSGRYRSSMRLGVLDIGSNTVHLLVADAQPGGRPQATTSEKSTLRLMRYLQPDGSISQEGIDAILAATGRACAVAEAEGVTELLATATSAIREATNGADVIARIEEAIGQSLHVLGGSEEARFTFLAVRRWFGWSAGQILLFDIGGGSLEIAGGADELPQLAESVPLGAGRMTVEMLPQDPPGDAAVERLAFHAEEQLAAVAARFGRIPSPDHIVGSSKTIRSLSRLVGYKRPGWSGSARWMLPQAALEAWIPVLARVPASSRQELPGITPERTFQITAGAVVLNEAMKALDADELEICPWALREGILLRYAEDSGW